MRSTVLVRPSSPRPGLAPVLVLAPVAVTSGCQEDSETPTGPGFEPAQAVAATGALSFRRVSAGWQLSCGVAAGSRGYCWGRAERPAAGAYPGADVTLTAPP